MLSRTVSVLLCIAFFSLELHCQANWFLDKVLDVNSCASCYFLVLDVKSQPFSGRVLIRSDELFKFLKNSRGLQKSEYRKAIRDNILEKTPLFLPAARIDQNPFYLSVPGSTERSFRLLRGPAAQKQVSARVNEVASHGCIYFVKFYFLGVSTESKEPSDDGKCLDFVRNQQKELPLRDLMYGDEEQFLIVEKLYDWKIPVRSDDLSTLPIIEQFSKER